MGGVLVGDGVMGAIVVRGFLVTEIAAKPSGDELAARIQNPGGVSFDSTGE